MEGSGGSVDNKGQTYLSANGHHNLHHHRRRLQRQHSADELNGDGSEFGMGRCANLLAACGFRNGTN